MTGKPQLVLNVDTGTDDAIAIAWAATSGEVDLVAVTTGWGNVDVDRATRNTCGVLAAVGRPDVPVYVGLGREHAGPTPARFTADIVMGSDGLNGVQVPEGRPPESESAVDALVRLTNERPGELTLVAVAPFTTIAAALVADPQLRDRFSGVTVMGGSITKGGNLSAASEANVGNDPRAASIMVDSLAKSPRAFTARLVGLDVTLPGTVDDSLRALARGVVREIWDASWAFGDLETHHHGLPVHDLLAAYAAVHPEIITWERVPLAVDTAGGAAWGATVADRRAHVLDAAGLPDDELARLTTLMGIDDDRWDVAVDIDIAGFRDGIRRWLTAL
ncbi:MAG: nucleoside hydrolase [Acidimicrobiia bacterium]